MRELDTFEARFAAAYHRYLDEMPVAVDATAVARAAAGARPRRGLSRTGSRSRPLLGWLVLAALLAVLALAAVLGAAGQRRLSAMLVTPTAVQTPAEATPAPSSPAPSSPAPAAQLPPDPLVGSGMASVTPLGSIAWATWRPAKLSRTPWLPRGWKPAELSPGGLGNALPLGTDHGPVVLVDNDMIWRSEDGAWASTPLPPDAYLPGASRGDELLLSGPDAAYRFVWSDGRWIAAGTIAGPGALNRPVDMAVGADGRRVLISEDAVSVSLDGTMYQPAAPGACLLSVVAQEGGFVGLGTHCDQPWTDTIGATGPIAWTSADGVTWVPTGPRVPLQDGAVILDVAAHAGRQVAGGVAPAGKGTGALVPALWFSDDGLAWRRATVTDPTCAPWNCVEATGFASIAAGDAGWMALEAGGRVWTSSDGTSWEPLADWPAVCAGYSAPLAAVGRDLVVVGASDCQRGAGDEVAMGTITRP